VAVISLNLYCARSPSSDFTGHPKIQWYCVGTVWLFSIILLVCIPIGMLRNRRFFVFLSMALLAALTVLLFNTQSLPWGHPRSQDSSGDFDFDRPQFDFDQRDK